MSDRWSNGQRDRETLKQIDIETDRHKDGESFVRLIEERERERKRERRDRDKR